MGEQIKQNEGAKGNKIDNMKQEIHELRQDNKNLKEKQKKVQKLTSKKLEVKRWKKI